MNRAAWFVLAAALGLRVFFAWRAEELREDERYRYAEIAANLREGRGFAIQGNPTAQAMPLWPTVLSCLPGQVKPHYLAAGLSALAVLLAWLLAKAHLPPRAAFLVLAAMALDLDQAKLGGTILTEPLFTVLLLLFALAFTKGWTAAAAGLLGLAVLTRPEAFLVPLALAAFLREWKRPLALLAGVAAAVTPWAWRNAAEFGAFVPFTTTGGITLNAGMNETEAALPFREAGQGRGKRFREALVMARERTEVADDRELARQAVAYALEHPLEALRITAAKAVLTLTPVQRKGQSFVYALATLALWWGVLRRRPRPPSFVLALVAVMVFVCLAFLALPRYRAPYHAFLFLAVAPALAREG